MTRFLLTCATLISVGLLPTPTMAADIVVQVRDLKGKSIADADVVDKLNSQIQIEVRGLDADGRESAVFNGPVTVPDRISRTIPIPAGFSAVKLVISDVSGGRVTATVDAASNTPQTIVVAMPEKPAAPQYWPVYYAACPPPAFYCMPIRSGARHSWFRHR